MTENVQTQIDKLAARVERLEGWTREEIFARTAMDEPDTPPGDGDHGAEDVGWMQARGVLASVRPGVPSEALIAEARGAEPSPASDEAAKWEDPRPWRAVADAYDAAYAALDDPMNFHDNDARVAGVQAAVAKAIELNLAAPVLAPGWTSADLGDGFVTYSKAAPADRAVVVTDEEQCPECRGIGCEGCSGFGVIPKVESALYGIIYDLIENHVYAASDGTVAEIGAAAGAIEAALRAAERGEGASND